MLSTRIVGLACAVTVFVCPTAAPVTVHAERMSTTSDNAPTTATEGGTR